MIDDLRRSLTAQCDDDDAENDDDFYIAPAMLDKGMLRHAHEFEGFVKHKHG